MKYMAPDLKQRVSLMRTVQSPNNLGGYDRTYDNVVSFWCEYKPIGEYMEAIRGQNTQGVERYTGEMRFRWSAVASLGAEFSLAFSAALDSTADLEMFKNDHFLQLQEPNTVRGRLFQIRGMRRDEKDKAYVLVRVFEVEERGTGW